MTIKTLRPMTLGDIFDEGFDLYKKNLSRFILAAAIVTLPLTIVQGLVNYHLLSINNMMSRSMDSSNTSAMFDWLLVILKYAGSTEPLLFFIYIIGFCALTITASSLYLGRPITLRQAYKLPFRSIFSLFITALIFQVIFFGIAFISCGVVFFWPFVIYLFAIQTFCLEGLRYYAALKRSSMLVSGDAGRVFGCLSLLVLLGYVLQIGFRYPISFAIDSILKISPTVQSYALNGYFSDSTFRDVVVTQIANAITAVLITPYFASVLTIMYYDLRVRKEAFDIELLASELGYQKLNELSGYLPPAMTFYQPGMPMPGGLPGYMPPPGYVNPGQRPPGFIPPQGYIPSQGGPQGYLPPQGYNGPSGYMPPPAGYNQAQPPFTPPNYINTNPQNTPPANPVHGNEEAGTGLPLGNIPPLYPGNTQSTKPAGSEGESRNPYGDSGGNQNA